MNDSITDSYEYILISEFYKDKAAARSKQPYMNHINEGLYVLWELDAEYEAQLAWCLHPFIQGDDDFSKNLHLLRNESVNHLALKYAIEYRNIANQYLSKRVIMGIDEIALSPIEAVNQMLVADKIQNYKDFILYHKGTHPRSNELDEYFNNWLQKLKINNFDEWFCTLKAQFGSDNEH